MKTIHIALLLLCCASASAQEVVWEKLFGNSFASHHGVDVIQASDGGFIAVGQTTSDFGSFGIVYLVRTNGNGDPLWEKTLPGHDSTVAEGIYPAADGAFYLIGSTQEAMPGDTAWHPWMAKLDADGEILWEKSYGPGQINGGEQTADGGVILTGIRDSAALAMKLDSSGVLLWERTFQQGIWGSGASVRQTSDGGYIIVGSTVGSPEQDASILLIRTSSAGDSLWANGYMARFVSWEDGCCVEEMADGGFLYAAIARQTALASDPAGWLMVGEVDAQGNERGGRPLEIYVLGDNAIGINHPYMSRKLEDGTVVISGATGPSHTVPFLMQAGSGEMIGWQKMLGELIFSRSVAAGFRPLPDGGFIVAGTKMERLMLVRLSEPTSGVGDPPALPAEMDLSWIAPPVVTW